VRRLKRVTAPSKTASSKASAVASPSESSMLLTPAAAASARAFSTIAGVRSTPWTEPTRAAIARPTMAGPQAASSQRAAGSGGTSSTTVPSVSAMLSTGLRA
jgi:hypothetical protein